MFLRSSNRYRVLQLFFDEPSAPHQLREISRKLKLGLPSVINHVKALEKEGFVKKQRILHTFAYVASGDERFRLYKKHDLILRLHESGLIGKIVEQSQPNCIILFGSARTGHDVESSDVDLFVQAEERRDDWSGYEKLIRRKINILYEPEPWRINEELRTNLANGDVLYGYAAVDEWSSGASRRTSGSPGASSGTRRSVSGPSRS
jgi:DNA-binding Lrp family transcriptional regulator